MREQRRPELHLAPQERLRVRRGEEFELHARVKNTTGVIDAFDVIVLGLGDEFCTFEPRSRVELFPNKDETVTIGVTLPDDYPAGETKLWIKASSQAEPAIDVVEPFRIYVEQDSTASIEMFPKTLVAGRNGRFGVTVHNTGNGPLNVSLDAADDQNAFGYEVVPATTQRIAAGATVSFQVILSGRRPFTGAAVPMPFTITPNSGGVPLADDTGQPLQIDGTFAPKPLVPMLVAVFAGVVALLALWAVVVGAAIDALVDDTNDDVASSIQEGLNAVVDGLGGEEDPTAAAQADVLAAEGAEGAAAAAAAAGLRGEAVGVTVGAEGQSNDSPPTEVAPNELAGTLAAASNGTPIPGAKVTAQALLPNGNFTENGAAVMAPDPSRPRITAISDELGVFRMPNLLPGSYDVTITVPGFVAIECANVVVPAPAAAASLAPNGCIVAGEPYSGGLSGDTASVAGIVTVDGSPIEPSDDVEVEVTLSRLMPVEGAPEGAAATTSQGLVQLQTDDGFEPRTQEDDELDDGRFSFVMDTDETATPGTFELVVTATGFSDNRQVFQLGAGQKLIGLQVAMVPPLPNATPPDERILSGNVLDGAAPAGALGLPPGLPGATVKIVGPSASYTVSTDEAGSYTLTGVPAGSYSLTIEKDDYLTASAQQDVPAAADATGLVVLEPAPGTLSGTVTDPRTGVGIAGVAVTIDPATTSGVTTVTTDIDGHYEFPQLGPGAFSVAYAPPAPYPATTGTVTVAPNQDRVADIVLDAVPPTGVVSGTVTDLRTGLPLSGVGVTITPAAASAGSTTDSNGWFRIDGLNAETSYSLTFAGPAGYTGATRVVRLGPDEQQRSLTVGVTPLGIVSGRVVTATIGSPGLAGATVSIAGPGGTFVTVTDAEGRYRFANLTPGTYSATYSKADYTTSTVTMIVAGSDAERPDVLLVLAAPVVPPNPPVNALTGAPT